MQTLRNWIPKVIGLLLIALIISGCPKAGQKSGALERAERYFASGEYDKAKIEYMNVLRSDQQNVAAFQQLGFIWFEQGNPFRAIPFLLKVRELAPQNMSRRGLNSRLVLRQ